MAYRRGLEGTPRLTGLRRIVARAAVPVSATAEIIEAFVDSGPPAVSTEAFGVPVSR
jgi:hypothetical protein